MKKKYVTPEGKIVTLGENDVITLSGDDLGVMPDDWFGSGNGGTEL